MPFTPYTPQTSETSKPSSGFTPYNPNSSTQQVAPQKQTLVGKVGKGISNFFGGLVSSEKGLGQDIAYGHNAKLYTEAANTHDKTTDNLNAQILKDKADGKDTASLEKTLQDHVAQAPKRDDFSAVKPSTEKVLGDVLGTATDVASVIPGVGAAEELGKGAIKQAAKKAATTGALFGAGQGAASAMQQDKGVVDTAINSAESGIVGGTIGALFGGAGAKLKDIISPTAESEANKAIAILDKKIDYVAPSITKGKAGEAVAAGQGTISKGTIFDKVGLKYPKLEKAVKLVGDMIDTTKTKTENINTLRSGIETESEQLKKDIGNKDHPVTFKNISSRLNKIELPISFKNDKIQSKTLGDITDAFMKITKEKGGKVSSLLDARKTFDNLVEENFPKLYDSGKPTTAYYAITRVRDEINNIIEEELPSGVGYKNSLQKQSAMYNLIDSMKHDAGEEVGKPTNNIIRKVQGFAKKNPITSKVLGSATGTVAGAEIAKKLGIIP